MPETSAPASPVDPQKLHEDCAALIQDWVANNPDDERGPWDTDDTIFEAQVLLVCEEIKRGNMTDRRIQRAVLDIRQGKHEDIMELIHLRLHEREKYVARMKNVGTIFDQLIMGERNRTVTRPAKYTKIESASEA